MVGFYDAQPADSTTLRQMGTDVIPSTAGEVFGASFGEGLAENLTPRLMRSQGRFTATTGVTGVDEYGRPIQGEPEPLIDPETANRDYGIKGHLSFDAPVPQSAAKDLFEHKRAQLDREDTIARRESGLLTGGAARFTASLAAGVLDPVNLAVGFIPVVGEAREAALLTQAGSAAARASVRVGLGAAQGATAMAALQPLEFGLSRQEHEDYTMAMALRSVALGSVLGGGLHAGVGALVDRATGRYLNPLAQRLEEAGPEARQTLLEGSLAQSIEGRPVDVAAALDAFDAARAESDLIQFARQQQRVETRADTALGQLSETEGVASAARTAQEAAQSRLGELRQRSEALRTELEQARQQSATAIDTATQERLAAINQELTANPPNTRRASLEAEQRMLTEGARTTPEADILEQARAEAQAKGLAAELRRTEQQAAKIENRLTREQTKVGAQETAANRAFGLESARISSQQAVIRELAARTIRRIAGRAGVPLAADEAATLAERVLSAPLGQAEAETRAALASLVSRSPQLRTAQAELAPDIAEAATQAAAPLRQSWRQSVGELFGIARRSPEADPIAARQATEVQERAPNIASGQEIEEAQRALDTVMKELQPETQPARPGEAQPTVAEPPELRQANEMVERAEGDARAYEKAAACLAERGL